MFSEAVGFRFATAPTVSAITVWASSGLAARYCKNVAGASLNNAA